MMKPLRGTRAVAYKLIVVISTLCAVHERRGGKKCSLPAL